MPSHTAHVNDPSVLDVSRLDRPERGPSAGGMKILRLTAQDDNSLFRDDRDSSLRSE